MLTIDARARLSDTFELQAAFEVPVGKCLAVVGPSGAGKSTVIRVIAGLVDAQQGLVTCGDEVWLDTERGIDLPTEWRRCGYMFQAYAIFETMSVWENVAYALRGQSKEQRRARAVELLERFGIGQFADSRPGNLSGGQRQRVALARALAREPSALLLDEPLSALDVRSRSHAARELSSILDDIDVPTVLVTHDFAEAALLGDEIAVVDGGRIIQQGSPTDLAHAPVSAFVGHLTGAVVLMGEAREGPGGLTAVDLDGGGTVTTTDQARGAIAVSVYPWEIAIAPAGSANGNGATGHNALPAEVISVTSLGQRVRLALGAGLQLMTAEISSGAAGELGLEAGTRVTASWPATATRVLER